MFAIIHIGGKQYKVSEKDEIVVEKVDLDEGKSLKLESVLMVSDDKDVKIGTPFVEGAIVECKVMEQFKGEKIRVFKMNPKKRYSKTQGHRQLQTKLKIVKISAVKKKAAAKKEA